MQSRAYNNFKTRERSITSTVEELTLLGRESGGNGQNLNKDTRHECRDAKINTSLENIKKHSDQIHLDISMAQNNDIESIKIELENIRGQLKVAEDELNKVTENKKYVDVLREILNDKGVRHKLLRSIYQL